jgi:hypothetical protein
MQTYKKLTKYRVKGCFVFLINVYILLYTVEAQQNIYSSLYKYSYFKVLSQGLIIKFITNDFRTAKLCVFKTFYGDFITFCNFSAELHTT